MDAFILRLLRLYRSVSQCLFLSLLAISAEKRTSREWQHSRCRTIKGNCNIALRLVAPVRLESERSSVHLRCSALSRNNGNYSRNQPRASVCAPVRPFKNSLTFVVMFFHVFIIIFFFFPIGQWRGYLSPCNDRCLCNLLSCRGRWNRRDGQSDGGPAVRGSLPRSQETDTAQR